METCKKVKIICILGVMVMLATVLASTDEIDLDGSGEMSDDELDDLDDLDDPDCIKEWGDCSTSDKPCCQRITLPSELSSRAEVLCFKFGNGVCRFREYIRNAEEYIRLSQQLNDTNFQALSTQYWKSVYNLRNFK